MLEEHGILETTLGGILISKGNGPRDKEPSVHHRYHMLITPQGGTQERARFIPILNMRIQSHFVSLLG
jgi:hypothetical protein